MTHIYVGNLAIIGSDNGLSPGRRQAIIWTNDGILLIGPSGTNFSEILIEIQTFPFKIMRLKVSFAKRRPFCLGLNVLRQYVSTTKCGQGHLQVRGVPDDWYSVYAVIHRRLLVSSCLHLSYQEYSFLQPWWRHGMETLPASLTFCEGNPVHRGITLKKGQ